MRIPNKPSCVLLLLTRQSDELVSYQLEMTADERVEIILSSFDQQVQLYEVAVDDHSSRQWKRRCVAGMIDIKFNDKEDAMQLINHHEP